MEPQISRSRADIELRLSLRLRLTALENGGSALMFHCIFSRRLSRDEVFTPLECNQERERGRKGDFSQFRFERNECQGPELMAHNAGYVFIGLLGLAHCTRDM